MGGSDLAGAIILAANVHPRRSCRGCVLLMIEQEAAMRLSDDQEEARGTDFLAKTVIEEIELIDTGSVDTEGNKDRADEEHAGADRLHHISTLN